MKKQVLIAILLLSLPFRSNAIEMKLADRFGAKGSENGKFSDNIILAFDRENNIYVADKKNLSIQKFSLNGTFQFSIKSEKELFKFAGITDFAVGLEQSIYVATWKTTHLDGTNNPKIFVKRQCVHRFNPDGKFVKTYLIDRDKKISLETGKPAIDGDGNFAIMVKMGTAGNSLLTVDADANIFFLRGHKVQKISADDRSIENFNLAQSGAGNIGEVADISTDRNGDLYVVDKKNDRILKYNFDGKFLLSFGDGIVEPFGITALNDNTLLVADKAKFKQDYQSSLPKRQYHNDFFQFNSSKKRSFRSYIKPIRRFSLKGKYLDKQLIRFDREDQRDATLELRAIDHAGNSYFVDTETLELVRFSTVAMSIDPFQGEFKIRYIKDFEETEIDNEDDLDADLYEKADFDNDFIRDRIKSTLSFIYDFDENIRLTFSDTLSWTDSLSKKWYRTAAYEDFRGSFNVDGGTAKGDIDNKIKFELVKILSHDPYAYREFGLTANFSAKRATQHVYSFDPENDKSLDFVATVFGWGGGIHYDLGRLFRFTLNVNHSGGGSVYSYVDEIGNLYFTGERDGGYTRVMLLIDGKF